MSTGAHAGNFVSSICSGFLYGAFNPHWEFIFYVWAFIGIGWAVLFFFTTYDYFRDVPSIKENEVAILEAYYEAVSKKAVSNSIFFIYSEEHPLQVSIHIIMKVLF